VRTQRHHDEALLVQDCPFQSRTDLPGRIGIDAHQPRGVRERGVVIRTIDVTVRQSTAAARLKQVVRHCSSGRRHIIFTTAIGRDGHIAWGLALRTIRHKHHRHAPAQLTRGGFHFAHRRQCVAHIKHLSKRQVAMRHLPAAKQHRELDLVPLTEKLARFGKFDVKVVRIDVRTHANFFEFTLLGVASVLLLFLVLLILPLAVVLDLAHRRVGHRRDFHQIQSRVPRALLRLVQGKHPKHAIIFIDQANRRSTNVVVDSQLLADITSQRLEPSSGDGTVLGVKPVSLSGRHDSPVPPAADQTRH